MKKNHKIYEEYNFDLEIEQNNPLYKKWQNEWVSYLKKLKVLNKNKELQDIKFNIVEHYTEDGLEEGDFDPANENYIPGHTNYKLVNLFDKDHKHIFLEFIKLNLDIKSIQNYISKYGLLGSPVVQIKYNEQGDNDYKNNSVIQSELLQCWYVEIKNLQSLIKNYQYYCEHNFSKLNEKFQVSKKNNQIIWKFQETEFVEKNFALSINFTKNNNFVSISEVDKIKLNKENIDNIFTEYTIEVIKRFYSDRVRAHVDIDQNWFRTEFKPRGLIGVIWHQVIKVIEEKYLIRNCNYCQKEFIIGQGEAKKNKEFCTRSHAVLSKREDNFSNSISKIFIKKGYEIKHPERDSMFDFVVLKNKKKISGINISLSESLDSKSKKWNFLIQKKIKEPMLSENLQSAYLINKNLDCFLFNKNNNQFKKLKSPMEYDSLIKFIKSNEKETKNK